MHDSPRVAMTIVLSLLVAACGSATIPAPAPTSTGSPPPSSAAIPSQTPGLPSAVPTATPPPSLPSAATTLGIRGSAREVGERIGMAPGPGGILFVSIPRASGSILALLDEGGRPRPRWPITIADSTICGPPLPVADGSVRIICDGTDLPRFENDVSDVRAFAFDSRGRSMAGWPVQLRPGMGRVVGDKLIYFAEQWVTDTYDVGTVSHEAWVTTIAVDGSVRVGTKVPLVEACCPEQWAIGPDGVAYGIIVQANETGTRAASELVAIGPAGTPAGFPVRIKGVASRPSFDPSGRIHVTAAATSIDSPYQGPARTLVFDTGGRALAGGSGDLGFVASDVCVAIEGSCEGPAAPLVGADGSTFVIGSFFNDTTAAGVSPSGEVMAGWPYRSDAGNQGVGTCPPGGACDSSNLALPALGPGNILYLIHGARGSTVGGSIVAVGLDGRVVSGWPVELQRPGAEFWSVVVGSDGTAHALAIEPEAGDASSASILAIAPDSTVLHVTTIIEP
jgi:hypothetical protein